VEIATPTNDDTQAPASPGRAADRGYLAREISRAYRKPLRPKRRALHDRFAKAISALSALIAPQLSERFARSARTHNPKRFDIFLRERGATAARLSKFGRILMAEDTQTLIAADVQDVRLPSS
jgi:hypothetical protein